MIAANAATNRHDFLVALERAEKDKAAKAAETAESMAKRQREISVSEFFTKNRHLLGFDSPRKALLTSACCACCV